MTDLRLILLICGVSLLTGIYLWGIYRSRKDDRDSQRRRTVRDFPQEESLSSLSVDRQAEQDIDYAHMISQISDARNDSDPAAIDDIPAAMETGSEPVEEPPDFSNTGTVDEQPSLSTSAPLFSSEAAEQAPEEQQSSPIPAYEKPTDIIQLHVIAKGAETISGPKLLKAIGEVDMQFGAMNIFHHYGLGEKMEQPIFSLANMIEPGNFDMNTIDTFETNGLVFFLCLPSPLDPEVVFELMLNTGERLAGMLNADLYDEKRRVITDNWITQVRTRLAS